MASHWHLPNAGHVLHAFTRFLITLKLIADCYIRFAEYYGTEALLVSLAMGQVTECPFPAEEVEKLKRDVTELAASSGFALDRRAGDRVDVPIDFKFLQLVLRDADDPETGLGEYSQGVKVGPGTRMPRLPALYRPKKKWRLASQVDPVDYLEQATDPGEVWRRNYSTLETFEQQVLEVMHDQASRGQFLVLSETKAKERFPDLVTASLGAQRREKPGVKITARVLFDGTHGLSVNSRTKLRDQGRAPIAADLMRAMREKAKRDELTFALTADVTEAHRQVPIHPDDWHYLGCRVVPGGEVFVNTVGTFGVASASCYWPESLLQLVAFLSTFLLTPAPRGTCWLPTTSSSSAVDQIIAADFILCVMRFGRCTFVLAQNWWW